MKIALQIIIFLIIVGFIYEQVSRLNIEEKFPPIGKKVNIDGHSLHYVKKGLGVGSVIFEAGLDPSGTLSWSKVQDEVAPYTSTLSYDRAGLSWSERGQNPKTADSIATELHTLLEKTNMPKPYILVGHSFGCLTLRSFVKKYPEEVAGIVFVDGSHPKQNEKYEQKSFTIPRWLVGLANNIGLVRLFSSQNTYPNTSKADAINIKMQGMIFKGIDTIVEEMNSFDTVAKEVEAIDSFEDIPLTVISAVSDDDKIWVDLQKDLLNLSTNAKHVMTQESGHYIQLEKPELVVEEIKKILLRGGKQ
ncbi:MAG TPA: alpha/beta hydrolase [Arcobacter sp.]|nr:alpha/beta hydrolase [Arcobacter sp.]